ncbi:hypothetical protein ATO12_22505 [Aquimarina atlantica]|uniref:Uncharacterized protein n=1 Tax=Aquimarina atlantica TaxID=1317122 RepID=A0A023BSU1_9FLAO|nr:hypothetical protein [Aquimarina atlantica]EZH72903.1 hypothetical protein ATO12_22505 [Aquimarina atlantica]
MRNLIYKALCFTLIVGLFCNCTSKTEKNIDNTNILLGNKKHLVVQKINKTTNHVGILSKHNYRTTHHYEYEFTVDRGDVNWKGGSGEPKHILFCKDSIYLHYLKEKYVSIQDRDTTNSQIENHKDYKVVEVFEVYIDNRYFFNLFGNDYWVEITPESYANKKITCDEYSIPNDNELSLIN